jgi:predicted ATPase
VTAPPALADVLRALREARGISQEGWAARLGYSRKTVQRWEHGETLPDEAAEEAIVSAARESGAFRRIAARSPAGMHLSEDLVRDSLTAARLAGPVRPPDQPPSLRVVPANPPPPHAPPSPLTTLVGRDEEITTVARLLGSGRLLTLTGPGGTGKTRLALAVAERERDAYPDGVWFVDLSPITDPRLVASAIAQVLGVGESEGQSLTETLKAYLRSKRLLMLMDNVEQVVDAAPLFEELLVASPGLVLLVTSRILLRISGECEYSVPPLRLPEAVAVPDQTALAEIPSVALFVERARDARRDFALTAENAATVATICTRLDGLPLAIELAAARLRILTPAALLTRLDHRLALLVGGGRDLPRRQQTLRNTIAWSYDLLTCEEQRLFRRLAVFAGGCTLEAAEAVGAPGGGADDGTPAVLDALTSLAEQSLLRRDDRPGAEPRFSMLETVREYAAEQLRDRGETEAARACHARIYLALAEKPIAQQMSPDPLPWLATLQTEHDNLRAALRYALDRQDADLAARLVAALGWFWSARGNLAEARVWAEAAVALGSDDDRSQARASALGMLGNVAGLQGDHRLAHDCVEQSLRIWREVGDARERAYMLFWLGPTLHRIDPAAGRSACQESAALFRALGDVWGLGLALMHVGLFAYRSGDQREARSFYEASIAHLRPFGPTWAIAVPLHNLGQIMLHEGDLETARALFEESLPLHELLGENGNTVTARIMLALVLLIQGELGRATALAAQAVTLLRALRWHHGTARSLDICAAVANAHARPAIAASLLGAAEAVRIATGEAVLPVHAPTRERALAEARRALGDDRFAIACAEGRALSLDAATALALERALVV